MAQIFLESFLRHQVNPVPEREIAYAVPSFILDSGFLPRNMVVSCGERNIGMRESEHHRKDTKKGGFSANYVPIFVKSKKIFYFCDRISILNHTYMFKEKIVNLLKTKSEIKRFGLSNEAIDRIASAREKTVTEESQVEAAVTDAETMRLVSEELMKVRDDEIRQRTETQNAFNTYKEQHPEDNQQQQQQQQQQQAGGVTLEQIQALLDQKLNPLTDKINGIESSRAAEAALTTAKEKFFGGAYAKKYTNEAETAWERAVEMNEAKGSKMTADELAESATGYFNKAVSRLGVDTSKPLDAEDPNVVKKGTLDWKEEAARQRARQGIKEPAQK